MGRQATIRYESFVSLWSASPAHGLARTFGETVRMIRKLVEVHDSH